MNLSVLEELVKNKESKILEFKNSTVKLRSAAETLCGFVNEKRNGIVLFGVRDDGKLLGQDVSDRTQQEIAHIINSFEPSIDFNIDYVDLPNNKKVIVLMVYSMPDKIPYVFDGKPFQRIETSTSKMPQPRYQQLLLEKANTLSCWEEFVSKNQDFNAFDEDEIKRTIKEGVEKERIPSEALNEDILHILERFELIIDGKIKNAAYILFGKNTKKYYPQSYLKMARFRGVEKTDGFIDTKNVYGNAFRLLEEGRTFIDKHLLKGSYLKEGQFERVEVPTLPSLAIREALANALCHRDYRDPNGEISIEIYDSYLEIWSRGSLPIELKAEDLKKKHASLKRNKIICNVFYDRGIIEAWGTGTNQIIQRCLDLGVPEPEFGEAFGGVYVRFYFKEPILTLIKEKKDQGMPAMPTILSTRQKEILALLTTHTELTRKDIMVNLEGSGAVRSVQRDLATLKEMGLIDHHGETKNLVWFLVHSQKAR